MAVEHVRAPGQRGQRDLRAWAVAEMRSFGDQPPARFRSADPSGTIRVTVGADDRVLDVELDADWRDRFGPEYFDTALLSAYRGALHDSRYVRGLVRLAGATVTEPASGADGVDAVVRSPAGYLRLVRRGRSIRGAHADIRRIGSADPRALCADVLAAFRLALG